MIMTLSSDERKQYNRHLILKEIGESGQLKLKQAKVLVIGAGGLGCPVLQYLTAAGVGTIGIIDHDVVDQSNLQRQILYTMEDIGCSKAETAAKRLSKLNPFVHFNTYAKKLNVDNALSLCSEYDIIVDGSDNFATRYLVNDAAVLTNKPLVYGAIFKFEGQVSVFNYLGSATYRCLYPTPPKPEDSPNCSEIGVLGVLPGIIGSLQANEVLKMITGLGMVMTNKLLLFDALSMQQQVLNFEKDTTIRITDLKQDYEGFCGIVPVQHITYGELEKNRAHYNVLDVREDAEREAHHIGGQHIPLGDLPQRYQDINTALPVVVYCKTGKRSGAAISYLKDRLKDAVFYNLQNGLPL